jgi:oligoribonuclease (3'-5' exoribonuclease)
MDDIRDSVAEMKYYRDRVFRASEELKKPTQ